MTADLSIAVPVFNKEDAIPVFLQRIVPILRGITKDFEIIDRSRNFGKESALTAAGRAAEHSKRKPLALWRLALEGIVSFSSLPLKLWSYLGAICATPGIAYGSYLIGRVMLFGADVPGYASLVSFILLFDDIALIGLGVIGEYIARTFTEVKARPLYLIRETWGINHASNVAQLQAALNALSRRDAQWR